MKYQALKSILSAMRPPTIIPNIPEKKTIEVRIVADSVFVPESLIKDSFWIISSRNGTDSSKYAGIITDVPRKQNPASIMHTHKTEKESIRLFFLWEYPGNFTGVSSI